MENPTSSSSGRQQMGDSFQVGELLKCQKDFIEGTLLFTNKVYEYLNALIISLFDNLFINTL